jgi:2-isopropylmalate synthase
VDRVLIFDTTLRDGEQAPGFSMNTGEKLEMARQLARLNVDVIEAGFPISSDEDFEATREVARQVGSLDGAPIICGLSRVGLMDIAAAGRRSSTPGGHASTPSWPPPTSTSSTSSARAGPRC